MSENNHSIFSNILNKNIEENYITNDNYKDILNGIDRLIIIDTSLDRDKDNPQRTFESMNSTGLSLSASDLIRNYILMGLDNKQQNKLYKNYWLLIEKNTKKEINNENKLSDFIRDYLTYKNNKIPSKRIVYEEFKKNISNRKIK